MRPYHNLRILFNKIPQGWPTLEAFKVVKEEVNLDTVALRGGVLSKNLAICTYVSFPLEAT
jgi:hypothetical protein